MVTGFGIAKMSWKIYNRWGRLVFETQDRRAGWDGTFNGEPQEIGTYSYFLIYSCGGDMTEKKGSVTLVR